MYHPSYQKPLKHILIGIMVDNDVSVKVREKQQKNKNKKQKKKTNKQKQHKTKQDKMGDKKNVYCVNSKIKSSKSCLSYF